MYVSPVESTAPGGCGDSNRFRPKPPGSQPGRPFAPGQLRLSRCSVTEGKMKRVMTKRGGYRGQCNRFPGICFTTEENPGKPQLWNRRGAHSSATSHCFKWGPAPLAKPIQIRPEKHAKKIRSRIRRPQDFWRAPTGHSSKILGWYHSDRPSYALLFSIAIIAEWHLWTSFLPLRNEYAYRSHGTIW